MCLLRHAFAERSLVTRISMSPRNDPSRFVQQMHAILTRRRLPLRASSIPVEPTESSRRLWPIVIVVIGTGRTQYSNGTHDIRLRSNICSLSFSAKCARRCMKSQFKTLFLRGGSSVFLFVRRADGRCRQGWIVECIVYLVVVRLGYELVFFCWCVP